MLAYITGVAGSGKSTLRDHLEHTGYRAVDADEGFCAWFDLRGDLVPTMPLELRTPDWYAGHRWQLLEEPLAALWKESESDLGFLLGVADNAEQMGRYFAVKLYLTAAPDVICDRLRKRDGDPYDTRFAAFPSAEAWQQAAEKRWIGQGYIALDSSGAPIDTAAEMMRMVQS